MKFSEMYWNDVKESLASVPNIEKLKGKKVLITGATGMLCSPVVDILLYLNKQEQMGIEIYLAGRSKERTETRFEGFAEGADFHFVPYDATSAEPLDISADYIIYGASNANPGIYTKQPVETMLGNIVGLNTMLKLAADRHTERVLYVSSSEVYGAKENNLPYEEKDYGFVDILNPRACYPTAKRCAETLCASYMDEYGVDTVIVRPGHIYGPTITRSDNRATAQFTWNVIDGSDIIMKSAGAQLRSYCYVLDCATALLAVLLNGERGNAYNISNKDSVVSIRAIAEALATYAGVRIIFENPSDEEAKGYNLMSNSSLNAEKLEGIGWKARYSLEEGVQRTIDYLR